MDDVVAIIDELEDLLLSKKKGFFSGKIYVDQDKVADIISQLREAIPQSFYEAKSILKQRDEVISEAERKAEVIIRNANAKRDMLVNESNVTAQAQSQANELIRTTQEYCEQMKYNVNQKLDEHLYDSAVRLNEALMLVEDVRSEIHKRASKDER